MSTGNNSKNKARLMLWRYIPAKIQAFLCNNVALLVNALFCNPIFNFYNWTLRIHKSTSIFHTQCASFTYDIRVCVCVAVCSTICLHRNPTFLFSAFTNQHPYFQSNLLRLHATFVSSNATLILGVFVAVQSSCDMLRAQSNILDL